MKPLDPRLIRRAAGVRNLLVVSVLLGLGAAAAIVAQAVLLAEILAQVIIGGHGFSAVARQVVALGGVIAVRAGLAWAAEELARRSAAGVITGLRRELLIQAAALGPRWRSGAHGGELAVLAGAGLDSLHDYLARYLPQLVLAMFVPIAMVCYIGASDLISGIIVACTLPLVPLFMALVGSYTGRETRAKLGALTQLAGHFADVIAGLPTLKVFGRATAQAAAVRRITEQYRRTTMSTLKVAFLSSMVLELLASLSVALVAVTIGLRLVSGNLTLQIGLTVLILAPEAYLPLRSLGTQFHAAADGVAAAGQVLDLLEMSPPAVGVRTDVGGVVGLRVEGVVVGDPAGHDRGVVGPLSFQIPAGGITVIVGPSGSGKTTLLHVLSGLLRPSTGRVLVTSWAPDAVDATEVDLAEVSPESWRRSLAWSGQRPVLRAGSIRDNLEAPAATEQQRRDALTDCAAIDFIDALPAGLDTRLGQDGAGLSQGQRQRICLARAVLHSGGASVVLLDEPTSALDEITELLVLDGLSRALAGRTVVLVSHRSAPRAIADHVVAMESADVRAAVFEPENPLAVSPW